MFHSWTTAASESASPGWASTSRAPLLETAWNASTSPVAVGDRGAPGVAGAEHASHLVEREERDAVDEGCRTGAGALPAGRVGHQEHEGGVRDQRREERGQPLTA